MIRAKLILTFHCEVDWSKPEEVKSTMTFPAKMYQTPELTITENFFVSVENIREEIGKALAESISDADLESMKRIAEKLGGRKI